MTRVIVKALIFYPSKNDFQILLLRRSMHAKNSPGIEDLPGGKVDPDELLLDAIIREVYEETQLSINKIKEILIHTWVDDSGKQNCIEYIFGAIATDNNVTINKKEHSSFAWIMFNDLWHSDIHPALHKVLERNKEKINNYIEQLYEIS